MTDNNIANLVNSTRVNFPGGSYLVFFLINFQNIAFVSFNKMINKILTDFPYSQEDFKPKMPGTLVYILFHKFQYYNYYKIFTI